MKKSTKQGLIRRKLIAIAVSSCFAVGTALANPTGANVVRGTADIHRVGNLLQITNSPNAIINWQSFSIGANEITRFIQQSSSSAVLNRVITQNPSQILGALQSNGRVFLINPNGILFGAGAQVDVAGLVASTLNLSDQDFLAGRLRFTDGLGKSVVNDGSIATGAGGSVYLIGSGVTNNGIIRSPQGEVILAAGNSVELVSPGTPNLRVEITATDNEARNLGQIISDAGRVGIYAGLVNHSGTIRADSAVAEGGRILLKATKSATLEADSVTSASGASGGHISIQSGDTTLVSGTVEAKATEGTGGRVELLGERVGLINAAELDVSGRAGGGTVLVGGDFQGGNPDVQNAARTYVGRDVKIRADATEAGNGGKVILWADGDTRYYGRISARGGVAGGNGGFVEVSGKEYLVFKGTVDTRAPLGVDGMLLLDPADIVILNGTGNGAGDGDASNASFTGNPSGVLGSVLAGDAGPTTIFESELQGIVATTSVSIAASNSIVINDLADNLLTFAQTTPRTVSFNAGAGGISMNAGDTIQTAGGALSFTTTGSATLGGLSTAGGAITVNAGGSSSISGVIAGAGTTLTKQGVGTLTLSGANTYTGVTTISAGTLAAASNTALGTVAGATTVAAGATLAISGSGLTIAEPITSLIGTGVGGGGALRNLANNNTWTGAIALGAGGARINSDAGTLTISGAGNITGAQPLTVGGVGDTTISKVIATGAGTLTKDGAGTLTLSGLNTYTGLTTVSAGTLRYGVANALSTGAVTVADGATYDLAGFSDSIGALTVNSGATGGAVTTGAGTLTLTGNITSTGGAANASIAGNLAFAATRTITTTNAADGLNVSAVISGAGGLTKAGAGTVTLSGANTYTGVTTISAGTLAAASNTALGTVAGATTVAAGATLAISGSGLTIAEPITSLIGTGVGGGGALRNLANNNTWTGAIALGAGGARINSDAGTLTISGAGNITGAQPLTVGGVGDTTISKVIATGGGTLTKDGAGTLTLSGLNTYTGLTTVSAGTLRYGVANALSTGAVTVADGATYDLAGFSDSIGALTVNSGATGGAVTTGAGTLTLTGNITSTGGAANASIAGNLAFAATRTITTTNAADGLNVSAVISGAGGLTKAGAGTLTLSAVDTYTGTTTINAGTLRLSGGNAIADAGVVTLANVAGAILDLNGTNETIGSLAGGGATGGNVTLGAATLSTGGNNGTTTYTGAINGTGGLTKQGTGAMTLSGNNGYTGATTISAGTLTLGAANRIADASVVTVAGGATFNLAGFAETVGSIAGAGSVTLGAGTLAAGGNNNSTAFSGVISGGGGLTKQGSGILTLSGLNTYTGLTTVSAGTLRYGVANALSTGAVTVADGATYDLAGFSDSIGALTVNSGATGGAVTTGAGTLTLTGNITSTGGAANASIAGNLAFAATRTITTTNAADGLNVSAVISGAGGLTKAGAGTVTLSGANTYTGVTTVSAGTLAAASNTALGTVAGATTVAAGATLAISGSGLTIAEPITSLIGTGVGGGGALRNLANNNTWTGAIALGAGGARINSDAGTLTISGAGNITGAQPLTVGGAGNTTISKVIATGGGTLTKQGSGILTLSGANTYTGLTTVSAGTLRYGVANALSTGAVTVADGATYDLAGFSDSIGALTVNSGATGGAVTTGAGTLTLTGNITSTGGAANASIAGNLAFAATRTITTTNAADGLNVSAVISGAGGLTKAGAGTVTLSGTNTYTGLTTVSAGTLVAANAAALGTTGSGTTVSGGATLNINSAAIGTEAISVVGNGVGGAGALTGTGTASLAGTLTLAGASRIGTTSGVSTLTLGGAVNGGGNTLDIIGAGNLTATNALNNFGTVTVNGTGDVTLVDANALTIGASSVGRLSAQTLSGNLTLGGNVTATGSGDTIVLAAAANFDNTGGFSLAPGGSGRWLIYSTSPAGSTEGGLTGAAGSALPRLYNRSFSGNPPASITEPGNHLIYSAQPALAVAPDNKTKTYGTNDPAQTFVALGFVNDDGVLDTAATAGLTGSFGRVAGETVTAPSYSITQGSFTSAAGYGITFDGTRTLTITAAPLTGTIVNQTKVYGANDPALAGIGVALSGVVNTSVTDWNGNVTALNDTGNVSATLASLTRTVGETVTGSPYAITGGTLNALTGSAAGNYSASLSTTGNTLSITAASLTGTIADQSKVYGANDPALAGIPVTLGGVVSNPAIVTWNGNVSVNDTGNVNATLASLTRAVGETVTGSPYTITGGTLNALTGSAAGNYTASLPTAGNTLSITAAPLAATIADQAKVYGADDPALAGIPVTLGGVVSNPAIVTWNGNVSVNDTGNVNATLASLTRAVGETVTGSPYTITGGTLNALTGSAAGNYTASLSTAGNTLTINQAALTGTIADQTKIYGANDPALAGIPVTLGGVVNNPAIATWNGNVSVNDTGNVNTTLASLTRAVGETVTGSPYAITGGSLNALSGSAAGNYTASLSTAGSTLSITAASLTGTIANQNKVYGADDPALAGIPVTLTGLVNNPAIVTWNGNVAIDDSALTSSVTSLARTVGEGVGGYNITAGTFSAPSANYSAPTFTGTPTLTITAAPLSFALTTPGQTKVYGADDPALGGAGVALAGLVNNPAIVTWNGTVAVDDSAVTGTLTSLTRTAGETVAASPYAITAGAVTLSASNANYAKSFDASNSPTLTINQAALSITANAQNKTYGASDPALTFSAAGLVSGTVNDWNGNATAINDTAASALSGALVRAAGETVAASPYAITQGTLAANANYAITTFTGSNLTIAPASLSVTADDAARPVNQPNPPLSATYSGFQFGETPAALTGTLSYSTPATIGSPAGSYAITPYGQSSTNYAISYIDGTLTVSAASPSQAGLTLTDPVVASLGQLGIAEPYAKTADCTPDHVSVGAPGACGGASVVIAVSRQPRGGIRVGPNGEISLVPGLRLLIAPAVDMGALRGAPLQNPPAAETAPQPGLGLQIAPTLTNQP